MNKLFAAALVLFVRVASAGPLGLAGDFNLFVIGDATHFNTDVQGRVAVGGNATFSRYGIGSTLAVDSSRNDLIVAGILNYQNGQIFAGSGTYGAAGTITGVGVPNGTLTQEPSEVDFTSEAASLTAISSAWNGLGGTLVSPSFGGITINALSPGLNIFRIAGFTGLNNIIVNVAPGATVLVNVDAASDSMANAGMTVNGDVTKVLFNFSQATNLTLTGFGMKGSILAPGAAFSFNNGHVDGNVLVASLNGNGQIHNFLFDGEITAVPEPSGWALAGLGICTLATLRLRRR
jgi:choice-of-anchor A domain-containing protein